MSETSVPITIGGASTGTDRTVRPALASDAHAIGTLQCESMHDFVSQTLDAAESAHEVLPPVEAFIDQWHATLSQPAPEGCATLVAIHGQQVGAFALALPADPVPEIPGKRPQIPAGTEVATLIVRREFQRCGHASRLLSAIRDTVSPANLRMWIHAEDEPRQRFAQSAGFAPAGVRRQLQVGQEIVTEHLWWAQVH